MTARINVPTYRRSVFQVALLMVVSSGLYVFVWSYFIRRTCAALLENEDQPLWKSVALIVPIFNFFMMFELGKKIEGVQWRADPARVDASLPWVGLSMFVFTVLGKLKNNASYLGVFSFVPIALMHHRFERSQIALLGEAAVPTRFRWLEWVAIALGGGLWILGVYAALSPESGVPFGAGERAAFIICTAVTVVALAVLSVVSRRVIAEGLFMHANPSADRIEPV